MRSSITGRRQRVALAALLFGMTSIAARTDAQSLAQQTAGASAPSRNIIAINPFLPLFGYFQGEYERRLQDNLSLAISGSHVRFDEYYSNLDVKLRLYPQDKALEGFGIAGGLGIGSAEPHGSFYECNPDGTSCADREGKRVTAPTFSVEAQYQFLLGRTKRTAVSFGGGAKRYFFSEADRQGRIASVLPTARFTVGYVFR